MSFYEEWLKVDNDKKQQCAIDEANRRLKEHPHEYIAFPMLQMVQSKTADNVQLPVLVWTIVTPLEAAPPDEFGNARRITHPSFGVIPGSGEKLFEDIAWALSQANRQRRMEHIFSKYGGGPLSNAEHYNEENDALLASAIEGQRRFEEIQAKKVVVADDKVSNIILG